MQQRRIGTWSDRRDRQAPPPVHARTWWLCGGALALALSGALGALRGCTDPLLTPAQVALAGTGTLPAEDELAILREQVAHLGSENVVLRTRLAEYASITGEGGVPPERVVVARGRIVARSSRSGRRYVELDVGRLDGLAKGMAVCAGWSLVGLVAGTDDGRCLVQVLTDSEFRVAAAVVAPPGQTTPAKILCEGVLAGRGRRGDVALEFVDAAHDLELMPGLAVVTAGSDGRLPAGLVLGTITQAGREAGDRWQVAVTPVRDPEAHESLLVLRFAPRGGATDATPAAAR